MLMLSRKAIERILLIDELTGAKITVAVVEIRPHTARIGIDAPQRFRILREELVEETVELVEEKEAAAT